MTDINGRTDIKNLYAIGETACTGLHGANRLASNSLLECIFFANSCFKDLVERKSQFHEDSTKIPAWVHPKAANPDELAVVSHMWDEIRRLMWNYVGIVRTNRRLMRAFHRIKNIQFEIREYYSGCRINSDIIELRNIAVVAELTVSQALKRKQSVGIHFNLDYPPIVAAKKHKKKSDSPLQNSSAQS